MKPRCPNCGNTSDTTIEDNGLDPRALDYTLLCTAPCDPDEHPDEDSICGMQWEPNQQRGMVSMKPTRHLTRYERYKVAELARDLRAIPIRHLTPKERAICIRANLRSYAATLWSLRD